MSAPSLTDEIVDDNLLRSPGIVRLAGASLGAVAFFGFATSVQLAALFDGWLALALVAPLFGLSGAALLVAPHLYNGRGWAAIAGTGIALASALALGGWAVFLVANLVLAPTVPLSLAASWAALALVPLAVRPALRVTRARAAIW